MYEPYRCNIQDYDFTEPENIYNKDGSCKYSYVTMLILGDGYLPGALTVGYSIIKMGSKIDRTIIITDDVSENARQLLRKVYNKIIVVPYIEPIEGITKKVLTERYPHYAKTFTKLNILNLVEYEKVLYLDADSLVIKNFDSIFNLDPPAAVYYGSHKMHENNYRPRLMGDKYVWHQRYCSCCDHGKKIPNILTDVVKRDKEKGEIVYGISAECMLLKPDKKLLSEILVELHDPEFVKKHSKGFLSDTGYITWKFSGQWTGIDPRFLGRRGYPKIDEIFGVTLGGAKPWVPENVKYTKTYPDYEIWYKYFTEMMLYIRKDGQNKDKMSSPTSGLINSFESLVSLEKALSNITEKIFEIRIFVPNLSTGLLMDAKIFEENIKKNLNSNIKIIKPHDEIHMEKHSDINIFLESIYDDHCVYIFTSKYNIFMVNQEFFDYPKLSKQIEITKGKFKKQPYYNIDNKINLYICKTMAGVEFMNEVSKEFNVKINILYTKFTSLFPAKKIPKDFTYFIHGAGSSHLKSTDIIVNVWRQNDLPKLVILCYEKCFLNLKKYVEETFTNINNIIFYDTKQDFEYVVEMKNKIGFHLCPSMIEGYGHYINEGRIASAIVLTIDAPPMNELITDTSGILIPYANKIKRKNGSYMYQTTEELLLDGVKKMLSLSEKERDQLRTTARFNYERDKIYFDKRMEKLCHFLKNKITQNLKDDTLSPELTSMSDT